MIPQYLIMKDFLSHSYSELDFTKFDAALILGSHDGDLESSNGSGKTSILSAIRWALFGKSRRKKKQGVVKRDAVGAEVEYKFLIDNVLYKIKRRRNRVVNETDVEFYKWDEKWLKIEGDTNTATDKKIVDIIGFNDETFINSIYFKQGDISNFIESSAGRRKDIIKNLLKLYKWDDYQKEAKNNGSIISAKTKEYEKNLLDIGSIEESIIQAKNKIEEIRALVDNENKKYDDISKSLVEKQKQYNFIADPEGKDTLKELEDRLKSNKYEVNRISKKIQTNEEIVSVNKKRIDSVKERLDIEAKKVDRKNKINIEKQRDALISARSNAKVKKEHINNLSKGIDDNKCNTCMRKISNKKEAQEIKHMRNLELENQRDRFKKLVTKIKEAEKKFSINEKIYNDGVEAEININKLKASMSLMEGYIKSAKQEITAAKRNRKDIDTDSLVKRIRSMRDRFNAVSVSDLSSEIKNDQKSLSILRENIDRMNIKYGSLCSTIKELEEKRNGQDEMVSAIEKMNKQLEVYNKLSKYFGKDGIQAVIIENVVGELENYTNRVLAKICNEPTSIKILLQRPMDNGGWAETFDIEVSIGNVKDDLDSLSTGEQFRVALAIRLAFSKILSQRMGGTARFLLLDEVSSSLDAKGLNMFVDTVKKLSKDMKILIITHDDRLKERFDSIIRVDKDTEGSKIL